MTGPGPAPSRERLPRGARIRSGADIRRAFREGRRERAGPLDAYFAPSPCRRPRMAVVVPRHGRTSAARNRLRRRLREIARRRWLARAHRAGSPTDLMIRARPSAYDATFDELETSLRGLFERQWHEDPDRSAVE